MKRLIKYLLLFIVAVSAGFVAQAESFEIPHYYYGAYNMALSPTAGTVDRPLWDISSEEMQDKFFSRLQQVGINMVTYAYVYRVEGPLYPHDNPELKPQVERWRGKTPVRNFLDQCYEKGITGVIGVHVRQEDMTHEEYIDHLEVVTRDVVTRFKDHPGFQGFVPPVESLWQDIRPKEYARLARVAKEVKPDLIIMDFPSGPHVPEAVNAIIDHSLSGTVDIENVQFFVGNSSVFSYYLSLYREMSGYRGLTRLLEGISPQSKALAHTHYMQGAGKENIPEEQPYRVSQNVLLTATMDGIHFFTYPHLFHGYDNRTKRNTFWRWKAWTSGALSVQRYAPYYAGSAPVSDVTTVVPEDVDLGGTDFVNFGWTPFAEEHITQQFAIDLSRIESQVLLVPSPIHLSDRQISQIQGFLKNGGTVITILDPERNLVPKPEMNYKDYKKTVTFEIGDNLDQIPPEFQALLDVEYTNYVKSSVRLNTPIASLPSGETSVAQGFEFKKTEDSQVVGTWQSGKPAIVKKQIGRGSLYLVPGGIPFLAKILAPLVKQNIEPSVETRNLPTSYILEQYESSSPYKHSLFLLLGTTEHTTADEVTLLLPDGKIKQHYIYFDDKSLISLTPEKKNGKIFLSLPRVENYGAILVTDETYPILHPKDKIRHVLSGSSQQLSVEIFNTLDTKIKDVLHLSMPPEWGIPPQEQPFRLRAGERKVFSFEVNVPHDVERETHALHFQTMGLTQRTVLIPSDGTPRKIHAEQRPPEPLTPRKKIGTEWVEVTAGDTAEIRPGYVTETDNNEYYHDPGVSFFYNAEWSAPKAHNEKKARFGADDPVSGGPNFWLNGAESDCDYQIRITYLAEQPGQLRVWNGSYFEALSPIRDSQQWQTADFVLPGDSFTDAGGTGNTNALLEFNIPQIYVHNIQARTISQGN